MLHYLIGMTEHGTLRHIKRCGSRWALCGRTIYGRRYSTGMTVRIFLSSSDSCKQCVTSLCKRLD